MGRNNAVYERPVLFISIQTYLISRIYASLGWIEYKSDREVSRHYYWGWQRESWIWAKNMIYWLKLKGSHLLSLEILHLERACSVQSQIEKVECKGRKVRMLYWLSRLLRLFCLHTERTTYRFLERPAIDISVT